MLVIAAYPASATLLLSTGLLEKILLGDDLKVEIDNPAWSVWPGKVHAQTIRVYLNGDTQLTLSVADAVVDVDLWELLDRHFHVTSLLANDIRFRLRARVPESEKNAPRVAAFPPMDGVPGDASIVRRPSEPEEKGGPSWTVRIENIDGEVSELWFLQYRYQGSGRVRGGFLYGSGRLSVDDSRQDLKPGRLTFGADQIISKNFRGHVQGRIPEIDPSNRGALGIFGVVDADIEFDADIDSLGHLGAYLGGLRVEEGAGEFAVRVGMNAGKLSPDSKVEFTTDSVRVLGDGLGIKSDWSVSASVAAANRSQSKDQGDPRPLLHSSAKLSTVSWARGANDPFTIQLRGHEQSARLSSAQIDRKTGVEDIHLAFPKMLSGDMDDLGPLLGPGGQVQSSAGKLEGSLRLDSTERGSLSGPLRLAFERVSLGGFGMHLTSSGKIDGWLDVDPKAKAAALGDFSLALNGVDFRAGNADVEQWWLRLKSPRLSASGWPPKRITTELSLVAKDAEPLLEALAAKDALPDIVAKLIHLENLKADAQLRIQNGVTDVMLDDIRSDVLDLSGRIYSDADRTRMALVVGGKTVSLGIYRQDGDTEFEALAGTEWLNRKLREFPPPADRVSGQKP